LLGCTNKNNNMLHFFKKHVIQEKYSHVDYNVFFENDTVDDTPIEMLNIGLLKVPTGKVVVCDPLVVPNMPPLNKTAPTGEFPIKLYIAKTKKSGDRFAIAKLEFDSRKADKWVLALRDGEDISDLKDSTDFFGFAVDAGLGGIFDYKAGLEYNKFIDDLMEKNPNSNVYNDFFEAEFKKNAKNPNDSSDYGDWINFRLPNSELNITMFQSGYGDGVYPAYWGMTKNNEIVSLVIDFQVLLLPDE
jgi:hypothetical protein